MKGMQTVTVKSYGNGSTTFRVSAIAAWVTREEAVFDAYGKTTGKNVERVDVYLVGGSYLYTGCTRAEFEALLEKAVQGEG